MKKLKLLTVGHSYIVGANRRLAQEIARLGADKWEVVTAAPKFFQGTRDLRSVKLQLADQEPYRIEAINAYFTRQVHCFWYGSQLRHLLAQPWDVVHSWEEPFIVAGGQIARWTHSSTRLVFSTFQNWSKHYPPPFNWIERFSMRRASGWIPFGQTIVNALSGRAGYVNRPFQMIPPGVDTVQFQNDPSSGRNIRESLGWEASGPPIVGFLGRFTVEKGLSLLTAALDRQTGPWRALFVGAGPMEGTLRDWSKRYGDRVRFCTQVHHAEVPHYLNAMDLLCTPSQTTPHWREQFGRMLIEAFACGVPVIGSDSGEIPYVLREDGIVLPEANEQAWTEAIGNLLENPQRRRELSARGRDRAVTEFDWSVVARQHLDFFSRLLDQSTALMGKKSGPFPATDLNSLGTQPPDSPGGSEILTLSLAPPSELFNAHSSSGFPTGKRKTLKLLSFGHSYVVSSNRKLANAIQVAGRGRWEITIGAPTYFHGQNDLRPIHLRTELAESCPIVPLSAYFTRSVHLFCYGRRLRQLLDENWDLVHCWEEPYIVAGGQAAWWSPRNTPFVFRTAQSLPKRYPPPFDRTENFVIRRAAGWICSGQTVAENLIKRPGYDKRPMALIPLGVDAARFAPDPAARNAIHALLGWPASGPPVVGYLGRFIAAKGLLMMMKALEKLSTPWRALFVGAGPLVSELNAWASRFPNQVRICTDVHHDDVPAYLNAMDMMCAPSQSTPRWREQFGRMLIEAFACGLPVIGSNSGEIPFVIRDTGRVVGENDVAGWQHAIGELLENSDLRKRLGQAGIERAVSEYDWSVIGQKHIDFFETLIGVRSQ